MDEEAKKWAEDFRETFGDNADYAAIIFAKNVRMQN